MARMAARSASVRDRVDVVIALPVLAAGGSTGFQIGALSADVVGNAQRYRLYCRRGIDRATGDEDAAVDDLSLIHI